MLSKKTIASFNEAIVLKLKLIQFYMELGQEYNINTIVFIIKE